jgi:hypothetical protein
MQTIDSPQTCSTVKKGSVARLDQAQATVNLAQRQLLDAIVECDRDEVWRDDDCRDLAQWLSLRLGISQWHARRLMDAAHTLPHLPRISAAFESGCLSIDKVVELCRFASPEIEDKLVSWAGRVTAKAIRRRADLAIRQNREDVIGVDRSRFLRHWWQDDGKSLWLEAMLPADQGTVVAHALDRLAGRLPDVVDDDEPSFPDPESDLDARRADALVALCSQELSDDSDADRAAVVVHAELAALLSDDQACEVEGGPVIHPETARRLVCDGRLQTVVNDHGAMLGIGRTSRVVPAWMLRALRYRDRGCTFPGCGAQRLLHAHHIRHWIGDAGPTEIPNLVLVCSFHHRLVHEHGWKVSLDASGVATWCRPGGRPYDPMDRALTGRAPPTVGP